jgi:hypothetical protein
MKDYTKEELEDLIGCRKQIIEPPKKEMVIDRGYSRNGMRLQSQDGNHDFEVFIRINDDFEENFSIGLIYFPRDERGDIHLLRCNGPHGPHREIEHHRNFYHIHLADPEKIKSGLKPERSAYLTGEYASFQEALIYFIRRCNIKDVEKHFPTHLQLDLLGKADKN